MAFKNIKIIGDDTAQVAIENDINTESVINALVAYNAGTDSLMFYLLIDDVVVVTETVSANDSFRLPDKLNIQAGSTLKVDADTGVNVTVSYYQQAIDTAAALTAVQELAQSASDDADRAENALPEGTIDDEMIAEDMAWSSQKISDNLEKKVSLNYLLKDADYTAIANDYINLDSSDGAFTVTLPDTHNANDTIIINSGGTVEDNNVTVNGNGSNLLLQNESDTSLVIDKNGIELKFKSNGTDWRIL